MGPRPAGRSEVLGEGVLDEGVGEVEPSRAIRQLPHEGHRRRGIEHVEDVIFGAVGRDSQEVEIEVPADDGRHREDPPCFLAEAEHPGPDHFAHRVGQGRGVERVLGHPPSFGVLTDSARLDQVAKHLAHEERVAVGLPVDGVGQAHGGIVESVPSSGLHQGHHPGVVQADEVDPGDPVQAVEGSQRVHQGIGGGELAVPVGAEDQYPHGRVRGCQMAEQQQASLVGPLEVVEDQDDGLVFRGHGQQAHHGGKEQEPLGVGIGGLARRQVRDPAGQCRDQPATVRTRGP